MGARIWMAVAFMMPAWASAQAFNGNFETLQPNGLPTAWSIEDPSGASTTRDAHLGNYAAKAWVYKNFESGLWTSTSGLDDANASEVSGYYKYVGEKNECDKAVVSYMLADKLADGKLDTLAYGATELKLSKEYKKFSLSVDGKGNGSPDMVAVQIRPVGHCNVHGQTNCCFLYVDDLILAGSTTISPVAAPVEAPVEVEEAAPVKEEEAPTPPAVEEEEEEEAAPEKVEPTEEEEESPENGETPSEEGGSEEPVEEGWDSEEESSDGGQL